MTKPRKPCPYCQRDIAIHNGKFNKHHHPKTKVKCPGSGLTESAPTKNTGGSSHLDKE